MYRGFIKWWRRGFDNWKKPVCENAAWLWLIGKAAHKKRKVEIGYRVFFEERGQLIRSYRVLAEEWGWSKSKVANFLHLKASQKEPSIKLERLEYRNLTRITIINYELYQGTEDKSVDSPVDRKMDSRGTDEGHLQECKELKEVKQSQPSAGSRKLSKKELQNRDIEKTRSLWKDVFGFEVEPSFVQVLVYGAKMGRRKLIGFGTFKGLQLWIEAMRGKDIENPKEYVWKVAQIEANVRHWRKLGFSTPSTIGEVFEKEILGGGPR